MIGHYASSQLRSIEGDLFGMERENESIGKHELTSTWRTTKRGKCLKKFWERNGISVDGHRWVGGFGGRRCCMHTYTGNESSFPPPLPPCRQNGGGALGFVGQHCCSETLAGGKPPATTAQVCGKTRNIGVSIGEVSLVTPTPNQPHSCTVGVSRGRDDLGEIPL